eukprot:m.159813 g.159813  ORF g.159813 m.159813 type:complete len:302 (-) comp20920_c0_seq1:111-1016(-)
MPGFPAGPFVEQQPQLPRVVRVVVFIRILVQRKMRVHTTRHLHSHHPHVDVDSLVRVGKLQHVEQRVHQVAAQCWPEERVGILRALKLLQAVDVEGARVAALFHGNSVPEEVGNAGELGSQILHQRIGVLKLWCFALERHFDGQVLCSVRQHIKRCVHLVVHIVSVSALVTRPLPLFHLQPNFLCLLKEAVTPLGMPHVIRIVLVELVALLSFQLFQLGDNGWQSGDNHIVDLFVGQQRRENAARTASIVDAGHGNVGRHGRDVRASNKEVVDSGGSGCSVRLVRGDRAGEARNRHASLFV